MVSCVSTPCSVGFPLRCDCSSDGSSAFTLFTRLLTFSERYREPRGTRLDLVPLEPRLVPDGRPLPLPVIYAGAGAGNDPVVKAYDAETGDLKFTLTAYESTFQGGVRVATGDLNGDGYAGQLLDFSGGIAAYVQKNST
jgi:hypothetical protein